MITRGEEEGSCNLLVEALVGSVRVILVQELLGLNAGCRPGRQSSQELVDDGIVTERVVGHGVRVQQSRCAMAEQLAVPISSVVIESLEERGGAIDFPGLGSKCLRYLRVDVEERWPLIRVLRPIPKPIPLEMKTLRENVILHAEFQMCL